MDKNNRTNMKKQNTGKQNKAKKQAVKSGFNFRNEGIFLIIITALIFLIYFSVISYPLGKLDEDAILTNNMQYISNISNLSDAFSRGAYFNNGSILFYRPMQNISFMIDAWFSGGGIWGFYLTNIIIHILTSIGIFYMLKLFIKDIKLVFFSVLIFAVNPLFAHSIAWTPSRGDLLLGMFGVYSFLCYLRYERKKDYLFLGASVLLYGAMMLSKESAVIFPGVIVFWLIFRDGRYKNLLKEIIPLALYTIAGIIYLLYRNGVVNAVAEKQNFGLSLLIGNLQTFPELFGKYFIPLNLSPMPVFSILSSAIGLIAIGAIIYIAYKEKNINRQAFYFSFLWFAVLTFPGMLFSRESGNFGYQYLEHRAYLPSIGLAVIVGLIINNYYRESIRKNLDILLVAIIVVFALMSFIRSGHYKSGLEFYNYAVDSNPNSTIALNNRGMLKNTLGDKEGAIRDFTQAVSVKTDYYEAYNNLGYAYSDMKNYKEAIKNFNKSLEINPNYPDAYYNRAIVRTESGDRAGAMADYNAAINLNPRYTQAYVNRSILKKANGDIKGALEDCDRALAVNPNMIEAIMSKATTLFMLNNFQGSIEYFSRALQIDANQPMTFVNRGAAYFQVQKFNEAISDLSSAIQLNPNLADAYFYRALSFQSINKLGNACEDLKKSASLGNPNAAQLAAQVCR